MHHTAGRGHRARRRAACARRSTRWGPQKARRDAGGALAPSRSHRHRAALPHHPPRRTASDSSSSPGRDAASRQTSPLGSPRGAGAQRPANGAHGDPPPAASQRVRHRFSPSRPAPCRRARLRDPQGPRPARRTRDLHDRRTQPGNASSPPRAARQPRRRTVRLRTRYAPGKWRWAVIR